VEVVMGDVTIDMDAYKGYGENYQIRECPQVLITYGLDRDILFKGSSEELAELLKNNKQRKKL
jgi:hypothetical protein